MNHVALLLLSLAYTSLLLSPAAAERNDPPAPPSSLSRSLASAGEPANLADSLEIPLRSDGTARVPDFVGMRVVDRDTTWTVLEQTPHGGSPVLHEQSLVISLTLSSEDRSLVTTSITAKFIDVTPPDVTIVLDSDQPVRTSPQGLDYVIAGATVTPKVIVVDPGQEIRGEPPVVKPCIVEKDDPTGHAPGKLGVHVLRAKGIDRSGNTGHAEISYEVRERPYASAVVSVQSAQCSLTDDQSLTVSGSLRFASGEAVNILTSTLRLSFTGVGGEGLPDLIPGGTDGTNSGDGSLTISEQGSCSPAVEFTLTMPPGTYSQCPQSIMITGSGTERGEAIDLLATASLEAPINPGSPSPACVTLDSAESGTCAWKSTWKGDPPGNYQKIYHPDDGFLGGATLDCNHGELTLKANPQSIHGYGALIVKKSFGAAGCQGGPSMLNFAGSASSGGDFKLFLEPANCCPSCTIWHSGGTEFKLQASVTGIANASMAGVQALKAPCGNGTAIGGVSVGAASTGGTISLGGYQVPYYTAEEDSIEKTFTDALNCVLPQCQSSVRYVTAIDSALKARISSLLIPLISTFESTSFAASSNESAWAVLEGSTGPGCPAGSTTSALFSDWCEPIQIWY